MKLKAILNLLIVTGLLVGGATGCKKKLQRTTPLPGRTAAPVGDANPGGPLLGEMPPIDLGAGSDSGVLSDAGIPLSNADRRTWFEDRQTFAGEVVYFDFDKSNVRSSEVAKIENVAALFNTLSGKALRIEGHCDERGTEEYNRALGERRALSIREYLITLGVNANDIETVSYGEDRPVDISGTEQAMAANRRGEFIVLSPPGAN